jgi:hypothetical protein
LSKRIDRGKLLKTEIENYRDLTSTCKQAISSYQVWWALVNRARENHTEEIELFLDFFGATTVATFNTFILSIANLTARSKSKVSINKLLDSAKVSQSSKDNWNDLVSSNKTLIDRLKIVRNKVVAHIDLQLTEDAVFSKYGFKPNDAYRLILDIAKILREIGKEINESANITETQRYEYCTLHVVKALSQLTSQQRAAIRDSYLVDPLRLI